MSPVTAAFLLPVLSWDQGLDFLFSCRWGWGWGWDLSCSPMKLFKTTRSGSVSLQGVLLAGGGGWPLPPRGAGQWGRPESRGHALPPCTCAVSPQPLCPGTASLEGLPHPRPPAPGFSERRARVLEMDLSPRAPLGTRLMIPK